MIMMNTLFQKTEIWIKVSKYTAELSTQRQISLEHSKT